MKLYVELTCTNPSVESRVSDAIEKLVAEIHHQTEPIAAGRMSGNLRLVLNWYDMSNGIDRTRNLEINSNEEKS